MIKQSLKYLFPFFIFFISYIILYEFYNHFQKRNVPNVIGLTLIEATEIFEQSQFSFKIIECVTDFTKETGTIIYQYPEEGATLLQKFPIYIKISIKKEKKIPDVTGKNIFEAESVLDTNGILYSSKYVFSWYPKNFVIAQSNQNAKINNHVTLYVSEGEYEKKYYNNCMHHACDELKNENIDIKCYQEYTLLEEHHNELIKNQSIAPGNFVSEKNTLILFH
jgi:beta-lactam-binding protein with PASTA domain